VIVRMVGSRGVCTYVVSRILWAAAWSVDSECHSRSERSRAPRQRLPRRSSARRTYRS